MKKFRIILAAFLASYSSICYSQTPDPMDAEFTHEAARWSDEIEKYNILIEGLHQISSKFYKYFTDNNGNPPPSGVDNLLRPLKILLPYAKLNYSSPNDFCKVSQGLSNEISSAHARLSHLNNQLNEIHKLGALYFGTSAALTMGRILNDGQEQSRIREMYRRELSEIAGRSTSNEIEEEAAREAEQIAAEAAESSDLPKCEYR